MRDDSVYVWVTSLTVAAFVGALGKWLFDLAKYCIRGPKLDVFHRYDEYGIVPTIEGCGPETDSMYARICVRNNGKETAKGCRGFLVDVEFRPETDSSSEFRRIFFDSIPLVWSYVTDGPQIVDVPKNVTFNLDLLRTRKGTPQQFEPHIVAVPKHCGGRFCEKGRYRFTIVVDSENATAKTYKLDLLWSQSWECFKFEEVPESEY